METWLYQYIPLRFHYFVPGYINRPTRELYNACGMFKNPQLSSSVHPFGAGSLKTGKALFTHSPTRNNIFRLAKMILNARTLFMTSAALAAALTALGAPGYVVIFWSRLYPHAISLRATCSRGQLPPAPW